MNANALVEGGLANYCQRLYLETQQPNKTDEQLNRLAQQIVGYQRYSPMQTAMELVSHRQAQNQLNRLEPGLQPVGLEHSARVGYLEHQLSLYGNSDHLLRAAENLWFAQQEMRQSYTGAVALGQANAVQDSQEVLSPTCPILP